MLLLGIEPGLQELQGAATGPGHIRHLVLAGEVAVGKQPQVKGELELGGELDEELVPGVQHLQEEGGVAAVPLHKFCIKLHFGKYTIVYM